MGNEALLLWLITLCFNIWRQLFFFAHFFWSHSPSGVLAWLPNGFANALPQPSGPSRPASDAVVRAPLIWPLQKDISGLPLLVCKGWFSLFCVLQSAEDGDRCAHTHRILSVLYVTEAMMRLFPSQRWGHAVGRSWADQGVAPTWRQVQRDGRKARWAHWGEIWVRVGNNNNEKPKNYSATQKWRGLILRLYFSLVILKLSSLRSVRGLWNKQSCCSF